MKKNDFKIGDMVKVKTGWLSGAEGLTGKIVRKFSNDYWTIKFPDFEGHDGEIEDGTKDKWNFSFEDLIKIKQTKKKGNSMKIELKKTEPKAKEITYPCFLKSTLGNELIVLFFGPSIGVVVDPGKSHWKNGHFYSHCVDFSETPLEGYSVTFSSVP